MSEISQGGSSSTTADAAAAAAPSGRNSDASTIILPPELASTNLWDSQDTLLLFSIVHMMTKEDQAEGRVDWDTVRKKLHSCRSAKQRTQYAFTSKDCEDRYLQLIQFAESNLKENQSAFFKREFIIQTTAHGLLCASKAREKCIRRNLERLGNYGVSDADADPDQELSDDPEGDTSLETEVISDDDSIFKKYSSCFAVANNVCDNVMSSTEVVEEFLKRCSAGLSPTHERDTANASPVLIVVDKNEHDIPNPADVSVSRAEGEHSSTNKRTPYDVSSRHQVTTTLGAPTLSKLLELPPRDRNQPLPQITSLVIANETCNNSADLVKSTTTTISPLEQQDSSTKLLAALGTTTTTVKLSQVPVTASDNLPFTFKLSESPLKAMDEIDIANDYVMESGLIPRDNAEASGVDEPSVSESSFVVPPSTTTTMLSNKIETDSKTQIDAGGSLSDAKNTAGARDTAQPLVDEAEVQVVEQLFGNKESDSKKESMVNDAVGKGRGGDDVVILETSVSMETSPGPTVVGTSTRNKPSSSDATTTTPTNNKTSEIASNSQRSTDNITTSQERKSARGQPKRETPDLPSTPVTRHTAKEKSKTEDSEEKQSTKEPSTTTTTRRLPVRSATGQTAERQRESGGDNDNNASKDEDKQVGKTAQRRLFTTRPTTPDIQAPNLRSRRIPTPTPGAAPPPPPPPPPTEEDLPKTTKRSTKIPVVDLEKEEKKGNETKSNHEDAATSSKTVVARQSSSSSVVSGAMAATGSVPAGEKSGGKANEDAAEPEEEDRWLLKLYAKMVLQSQNNTNRYRRFGDDYPGDDDYDNSNSGTDASASKKRLTRRSVKIGSASATSTSNSKDADDGESSSKDDSVTNTKETKTKRKPPPVVEVSDGDESVDNNKSEELDGKRVTRARAKTSVSPSRAKSIVGSSKTSSSTSREKGGDNGGGGGGGDNGLETPESSEAKPSRATRSRLGVSTSSSTTSTPTTESAAVNPSEPPHSLPYVPEFSPSRLITKEELILTMSKDYKTSLIDFVDRIGEFPNASMFNLPTGTEELAKYKKQIKRPMDLEILKKNIAEGVIKTPAQFRRDLNLMFVNLIMYNHLPGTITDEDVAKTHKEVTKRFLVLNELYTSRMQVGFKAVVEADKERKSDSPDQSVREHTETDAGKEAEKAKLKPPATTETPRGRKRRNTSLSTSGNNSEEAQESNKRRTLRTSTAAATTATSASWQNARQKKSTPSTSGDTGGGGASSGRGGRQHE